MTTHVFTVVLDQRPVDDRLDDLLGDDDLQDASFGIERGIPIVEFDREAQTLADAIVSAVHKLESVGLIVMRVLDNDLLTLADIADRIGQSRESIRRYSTGERGPGGFPPPANLDRGGTVFYRWSEIAPWLRSNLDIDAPDNDTVLVAANLILQARQLRGRVDHMSVLSSLLAA